MSGFRSSHFPARHALASCGCHTACRRDVLSLSLPGKVSQLPPQAGSRTPVDQKHPLPPNRLTDASHSSLTGLRQNLQEFFGLLAVDIGRPRFEPSCLVVLRVPHGRPTPKAGSTSAISVKSPSMSTIARLKLWKARTAAAQRAGALARSGNALGADQSL